MNTHQHSLEPLYTTQRGTVLQCRACGRTNLFFGSIILSQEPGGLDELRRIVDELEPVRYPGQNEDDRRYMLRTPDRQIGFAFTRSEIEELRDLLAGATTMSELSEIIAAVQESDVGGGVD